MSEILYIQDLAAALGRSEAAVRSAIQRRDDTLPPMLRIGRRWACRRSTLERWLAIKERALTEPLTGSRGRRND